MFSKVDAYLVEGCGRCANYRTPQCKVHTWTEELQQLRRIVLECKLEEEFKWSQPCYTFQGKNILMVTAFKDFATLSFFKGTLLNDEKGLLQAPGENSQAVRQLRFTSAKDITEIEPVIKAYIHEAIQAETAGLKVKFKKNPEPIPEELKRKLDEDRDLRRAFEALTPGRQRGYILYFTQPKQSKTRTARIVKYIPKILEGIGLQDTYKATRNK